MVPTLCPGIFLIYSELYLISEKVIGFQWLRTRSIYRDLEDRICDTGYRRFLNPILDICLKNGDILVEKRRYFASETAIFRYLDPY